MRKTTLQLFEEKFIKTEDNSCWNWSACIMDGGYGLFAIKRKPKKAHRVSYEIYVGKITDNLHVLHTCDNRKCVNPNHLFLGTNLDNVQDKMKKGRIVPSFGGKNGSSKLDEKKIIEIRSKYIPLKNKSGPGSLSFLAKEYGVYASTIWGIVKRRTWTHVD